MRAIAFVFDLSTTEFKFAVRSKSGDIDHVSIPMRGQVKWKGQPAFDLSYLPGMIEEALNFFRARGWTFGRGGAISYSVRQHDMVLLGRDNKPLIPALSWQCSVAKKQTELINSNPANVAAVGVVEPRFILPKLGWALKKSRDLAAKVRDVLTTGDYIAYMLTGKIRLST